MFGAAGPHLLRLVVIESNDLDMLRQALDNGVDRFVEFPKTFNRLRISHPGYAVVACSEMAKPVKAGLRSCLDGNAPVRHAKLVQHPDHIRGIRSFRRRNHPA